MNSAIIYTRSAIPNKLNLAVQEKAGRDYAQAKGLKVLQVFSDDGYSGTRGDRSGIEATLDYILEHKIKYLIAASPDRLARSFSLLLELDAFITARGAEFIFANESSSKGIRRMMESLRDTRHKTLQ